MDLICCPVSTFHNFIVLSQPPEARVFPSGENAIELIQPVCPLKDLIICPVSRFHKLIVSSKLSADARVFPSGENATELSRRFCPSIDLISLPVSTFHILMVLSRLTDVSVFPSDENITV